MSKAKTQKTLRKEELSTFQQLTQSIRETARLVGMYELQKAQYVSRLDGLNSDYEKFKKKLTNKYGEDASINFDTGEIVRKEKDAQ